MGVLRAKVNGDWVEVTQQYIRAGGIDVADEGVVLAGGDMGIMNFVGDGVTVTPGVSGEAIITIPGPAEPTTPDEYTFPVPLTEWVINHNKNIQQFPIRCYDLAGVVEYDPEIEFATPDQCIVHWFYPTTGFARILK